MSWDILPKSNLQYFLTKLKGIFDNKVDKETGKGLFSGNYNDLTNKPASMPASDVYAWAKAATKPSYTASEIGALAVNGTAAKATADADGNAISSTYMKKGVDRVTAGQSIIAPIGTASTADGFAVNASGDYSHASGYQTIASSDMQHVIGKYNEEDANGVYAFIVGGGRLDFDRKNIFTIDWNGDVNAGRSNGLTNDTKLPTGADVISYLNSNIVNAGSNQINFSTTPQTYATSGSMWVQIIGKVCILSFVDLGISNSPTNNAVLIASNLIPISKYQVSSILIDSTGTGGVQKVMIGANTNSIYNYWTSDSIRKNGYFHGQLVYIIA